MLFAGQRHLQDATSLVSKPLLPVYGILLEVVWWCLCQLGCPAQTLCLTILQACASRASLVLTMASAAVYDGALAKHATKYNCALNRSLRPQWHHTLPANMQQYMAGAPAMDTMGRIKCGWPVHVSCHAHLQRWAFSGVRLPRLMLHHSPKLGVSEPGHASATA